MNDIYPWQQAIGQKLLQSRSLWGHAVLLKGKKGTGKYDFARLLAQSLLCTAPATNRQACGQCVSCGWFEQNGHPNFHAVLPEALTVAAEGSAAKTEGDDVSTDKAAKKSASQQIGIEQIRKLNDFVYLTGHQSGYKIILIYPAEAMNTAAANALLKKLEEPPPDVLFLLVTHQAQHLLPTIRSRCQQLTMPAPDITASLTWLRQQGINDAEQYLAAAGYSPLLALQLAQGDDAQSFEQFIRQVADPKRLDPLLLAEALQQNSLPVVVTWLQKWCYDLVSYRATGKARYFLKQLPAIQALSSQLDPLACGAFFRELNHKQKLAHHPLNPRLFLEDLFIAYAALAQPR
ncbi:MAG: DNA polymerase III subunit delta' [Proteobacteria bacterium SG_bin4]|nr:MAG: DNA polymerase III subunit delta' [Proteobacteria bacterium SG_bin4]